MRTILCTERHVACAKNLAHFSQRSLLCLDQESPYKGFLCVRAGVRLLEAAWQGRHFNGAGATLVGSAGVACSVSPWTGVIADAMTKCTSLTVHVPYALVMVLVIRTSCHVRLPCSPSSPAVVPGCLPQIRSLRFQPCLVTRKREVCLQVMYSSNERLLCSWRISTSTCALALRSSWGGSPSRSAATAAPMWQPTRRTR